MQFFLNRLFRPRFLYLLLNSKKPLSNIYGLDRGMPIDRYYIENFLFNNKDVIKGNCLEVLDNHYTIKFGGAQVQKSDILDINEKNENATIIGDIRNLSDMPNNQYDCIILTQVLQFIDDLPAAIKECWRILKQGGVLLATLPSISRIDCVAGIDGDFWRFTEASTHYLFNKQFKADDLDIKSYGNVLADIDFLVGLSREEIDEKVLLFKDENFPCLISVKAIKR